MGDVPQMPGGMPFNPFGNNLADLMRQLANMLESPGPVNMEIARNTAAQMANADLDSGEPRPELPVDPEHERAFDDVVRAVQLAVSESTGLTGALSLPASCVTRTEWSHATLTGLEPVLGTLAATFGRGMPPGAGGAPDPSQLDPAAMTPAAIFGMLAPQLMPLLLGTWAGSMIGLLSQHVLGQYELPLPLDGDPALRFVDVNVGEFASEWSLPLDELRYALALREVVHGAQRAVPWVRQRLVRLSSDYVGAYEVQPGALAEQFGEVDPSDPAAMEALSQLADPEAILGALRSERQGPLLAELQRFIAVIEGYTDVVVETLGSRMVSSHVRIDEALRRQRLERGDATAFVDRLLGLELEREHYDMGGAFCRGVLERTDGRFDQLNRLWTDEAVVPTPAELEAPGLWLARIDLPA